MSSHCPSSQGWASIGVSLVNLCVCVCVCVGGGGGGYSSGLLGWVPFYFFLPLSIPSASELFSVGRPSVYIFQENLQTAYIVHVHYYLAIVPSNVISYSVLGNIFPY